jgi:hypothetical protein
MGFLHVNQRIKLTILAAGSGAVLLVLLILSGRAPMHLKTVSDQSLQELGLSLYQPGPAVGQLSISPASALAIVQHSYAGMGPVKEEVLARVHFTNGASVNDQICWVLVQPTSPLDSAGYAKAFGLEVIDAHTGSVLWAGGEMGNWRRTLGPLDGIAFLRLLG